MCGRHLKRYIIERAGVHTFWLSIVAIQAFLWTKSSFALQLHYSAP